MKVHTRIVHSRRPVVGAELEVVASRLSNEEARHTTFLVLRMPARDERRSRARRAQDQRRHDSAVADWLTFVNAAATCATSDRNNGERNMSAQAPQTGRKHCGGGEERRRRRRKARESSVCSLQLESRHAQRSRHCAHRHIAARLRALEHRSTCCLSSLACAPPPDTPDNRWPRASWTPAARVLFVAL